ncbi:MAG: hypothetical protein AAGF97_15565, partial [Planctomycetota bacterium]
MPNCLKTLALPILIALFAAAHPALAADLAAVERGLGHMVSKGDLSLREASLMLHVLRRANSGDGYERRAKMAAVKKIRMAVQAGDLTEEEAREKMRALRQERGGAREGGRGERGRARRSDREDRAGDRSPRSRTEQRRTERPRGDERRRAEGGDRGRRDDAPRADRDRRRREMQERARGGRRGERGAGRGALRELGIEPEEMREVAEHLREAGFDDDQLRPSVGAMVRMAYGQREGLPEVDERIEHFLSSEAGLNDEQIERVR